MSNQDAAFRGELERRMAILESAAYDDPARSDLPGRDIAVLAAVVALVVLISYAVLY